VQIEQPDFLDAGAVAELFQNVTKRQVYRWASAGSLRSIKLSRKCLRFDRADVERFIESNRRGGEPAQ
jgi:excisionase family DNA binding protein